MITKLKEKFESLFVSKKDKKSLRVINYLIIGIFFMIMMSFIPQLQRLFLSGDTNLDKYYG